MCWAIPLLSVISMVQQRGDADHEMCCQSGQVISHEQGLYYNAGFAVPVLMSWWGLGMERCYWLSWLCSEAVHVGPREQ